MPVPAHLQPLHDRLLSLGGDRVVLFLDGYEEVIRDCGIAVPGGVPAIKGGLDSSCHQTSAILQLLAPGRRHIVTGYALSEDGCWRRHSWAMQDGKVMEPTVERLQYFGVTLEDEVDILRFIAPEVPVEVYVTVAEKVAAGHLGGKVFKKADLVRVQRLIDAGHRGQP